MDQTNVGNMGGYYGRQYSTEEMQRMGEMDPNGVMGYIGSNGLDTAMMEDGQTLDEIINQNSKELQRRQTFHQSQAFQSANMPLDRNPRRSTSMLDFSGMGNDGHLNAYQFDPAAVQQNLQMQRPPNMTQRRLQDQPTRRGQAPDNLALNTQFHNMGTGYSPMTSASPFPRSAYNSDPMSGLDMTPSYMDNNMMMGMEFSTGGLSRESSDMSNMNSLFTQQHMSPHMSTPAVQQDMSHPMRSSVHDPSAGHMNHSNDSRLDDSAQMQMTDPMSLPPPETIPKQENIQSTEPMQRIQDVSNFPDQPSHHPSTQQISHVNPDTSNIVDEPLPSDQNMAGQSVVPQYKNAYSSSGFDMLGVLMRVANRPNPQINIGAVDMSCAFAVCDVTQHDIPIVYCSDIFERLTGYTKHEILGRNCRFLQAPDGKIQAGLKRKYVDDQSVWRIKNMITARQEMQTSIINYRKGGQPFMNLLTMIPIGWDSDEIKYYVGFQVDLVEQPTSITNKNPGMLQRFNPWAPASQEDTNGNQTDRLASTISVGCFHAIFYQNIIHLRHPNLRRPLAATKFLRY